MGPHQQLLRSARTQQLQLPPEFSQSMATLQGVLRSQGHCGLPGWANAGVFRLVRTGADHATAAPAPMRFSIRRREIPSCVSSVGFSDIWFTSLRSCRSKLIQLCAPGRAGTSCGWRNFAHPRVAVQRSSATPPGWWTREGGLREEAPLDLRCRTGTSVRKRSGLLSGGACWRPCLRSRRMHGCTPRRRSRCRGRKTLR